MNLQEVEKLKNVSFLLYHISSLTKNKSEGGHHQSSSGWFYSGTSNDDGG